MFAPKTEIHFIAQDHSMHTVSTAQCEQVCFCGGHFADPVMSQLREWHLVMDTYNAINIK